MAAIVSSCDESGNAILSQRNKFYKGDVLELLLPKQPPIAFTVEDMYDDDGAELEDTRHAQMNIHTRLPVPAPKYAVIRKKNP